MHFRFGETDIAVTHPDRSTLLSAVADRFAARQGFALATINLDHLVKLNRSPQFRAAYAAQDFVVADGNPIVWLSRLARHPTQLVPGSDLVEPLCRKAAEAGLPVSMFGTSYDALHAAVDVLARRIPGFRVGVLISPAMGFDPEGADAREALREIASIGPGLCLIALGAPKQEEFAALGRCLAPETGFASVGAGVDFIAGYQARAPLWMRSLAMEWLWRALSAPRRLVPRYLACLAILPGQLIAALKQRQSG